MLALCRSFVHAHISTQAQRRLHCRLEGGGAEPCGSVSECHTEQKEWNNGSNVGDTPCPRSSLPSYSNTPPHPLFHSLLMTHRPHAQHLDAHKHLYNGGGWVGWGDSGMQRKCKNSRAAVQIQSEADFSTSTLWFLQKGEEKEWTHDVALEKQTSGERSPVAHSREFIPMWGKNRAGHNRSGENCHLRLNLHPPTLFQCPLPPLTQHPGGGIP